MVHDFEDESSFIHRKLLAKGEIEGAGYFTIDFSYRAERLEKEERFAVIVNIHTDGENKPVAMELMKDKYTRAVTLEGKESYISLYGGTWEKTQDSCQANVCLKAYTGEISENMN